MQRAFISRLLELAQQDKDVVYVLADSGTNFDIHFERNYPDRIFNFGIAEQNAVGAAAGMALAGKKPFVFLQGSFIVYRAMEFVRDDICFQELGVRLVGQGSGLSLSGLGPSHHTTEDIAVLRSLPNMKIYSPATPAQVVSCMNELAAANGPCYLRIGMNDEKEFFAEGYELPDSGQDIVKPGKDAVIFSTGSILEEVSEAANILAAEGIDMAVINAVRLKPFDSVYITQYAPAARKIFTVEEHQVRGGLGSIVAEALADEGMSVPLVRIGLEDTFAAGYAPDVKQVRRENGLDAKSIAGRIRSEIVQ